MKKKNKKFAICVLNAVVATDLVRVYLDGDQGYAFNGAWGVRFSSWDVMAHHHPRQRRFLDGR